MTKLLIPPTTEIVTPPPLDLSNYETVNGVILHPLCAVVVADDYPFDSWADMLMNVGAAHNGSKFWIGDMLLEGERRYGEMYTQAMDALRLDYSTLANYVWVSRAYFPDQRWPMPVTHTHHRVASRLPPEDRHRLLAHIYSAAVSGDYITTKDMKQLMPPSDTRRASPRDRSGGVVLPDIQPVFGADGIGRATREPIIIQSQDVAGNTYQYPLNELETDIAGLVEIGYRVVLRIQAYIAAGYGMSHREIRLLAEFSTSLASAVDAATKLPPLAGQDS